MSQATSMGQVSSPLVNQQKCPWCDCKCFKDTTVRQILTSDLSVEQGKGRGVCAFDTVQECSALDLYCTCVCCLP